MIVSRQTSNGKFQFDNLWKAGTSFTVTLAQKDADGDIDTRTVSHTMDTDMPPPQVLKVLTEKIDDEFNWRASAFGLYLSVESLEPQNDIKVTLNVQEP